MPNVKRLSAHYQVAVYLRSEAAGSLTTYDRLLLRVIADYIDMGKERCFKNDELLAKECNMGDRTFRRSIATLIKKNLLKTTIIREKKNYILGEFFTCG